MRRTERRDAVYRPRKLSAFGEITARDSSLHEEGFLIQHLHLENPTGLLLELDGLFQL